MTGDYIPIPYAPFFWAPHIVTPGFAAPAPIGCICPPTSEQTCENAFCPRRDLSKVEAK